MFLSLYQLIAVKQNEVEARRGYIEALRDYWSARAELARRGRRVARGGATPVRITAHFAARVAVRASSFGRKPQS
jgi:cobalt-zinc-cadmium efflux system outer membrane protein